MVSSLLLTLGGGIIGGISTWVFYRKRWRKTSRQWKAETFYPDIIQELSQVVNEDALSGDPGNRTKNSVWNNIDRVTKLRIEADLRNALNQYQSALQSFEKAETQSRREIPKIIDTFPDEMIRVEDTDIFLRTNEVSEFVGVEEFGDNPPEVQGLETYTPIGEIFEGKSTNILDNPDSDEVREYLLPEGDHKNPDSTIYLDESYGSWSIELWDEKYPAWPEHFAKIIEEDWLKNYIEAQYKVIERKSTVTEEADSALEIAESKVKSLNL